MCIHGSVLGPLCFLLNIYNLGMGIHDKMAKFADEIKLGSEEENSKPQKFIDRHDK